MSLPPNITTTDQAHRFVGGRRRYNFTRQFNAISRRWQLLFTWAKHPHWTKADLARHFGVSRATITRDIQKIKADHEHFVNCPLCKGTGRIDNGLDNATTMEVVSDITRAYGRIFKVLGQDISSL